jgi:hypothetical protein
MAMAEAPFAILDQPHYARSADQWFEDGYVLYAGRVYRYSIDRKDQIDDLSHEWEPDRFLCDASVPEEARAWLRAVQAASGV